MQILWLTSKQNWIDKQIHLAINLGNKSRAKKKNSKQNADQNQKYLNLWVWFIIKLKTE